MITIIVICERSSDRATVIAPLSMYHDFKIVGWGKDGYDALHYADILKPNVIIMDMYFSGTNAASLAPMLKRKSPSTALMALGDLDQNHPAGRVLAAGIAAYLLKQEDMDKLAACVRLIHSGGHYLSISILRQILSSTPLLRYFPGQLKGTSDFLHNCMPFLSSSERRIIVLITQGLRSDEIAKRLGLKEGSVRNCLTRIKQKTGTKSRVEIAFYSLIHGLIHFEQIRIFKVYTA